MDSIFVCGIPSGVIYSLVLSETSIFPQQYKT